MHYNTIKLITLRAAPKKSICHIFRYSKKASTDCYLHVLAFYQRNNSVGSRKGEGSRQGTDTYEHLLSARHIVYAVLSQLPGEGSD